MSAQPRYRPNPRRPVVIIDGYATIALSNGAVAKFDVDDVPLVEPHSWFPKRSPSGGIYAQAQFLNECQLMHRRILGITDPGIQVDHVNRDPLDNRRCNLRICSGSQNGANRLSGRLSKSGFKGVTPKRQKWQAYVGTEWLGVFDSPEDAARAYDKRAIERWGEFALTNARLGLLSEGAQ